MDNMGSPSSMVQKVHSGVGQANIETNSVAVKRNGGPFSHFLSEDMDTDTTTTVNPNPNPIPIVKVTAPVLAAVVKEDVISDTDNSSATTSIVNPSSNTPYETISSEEVQTITEEPSFDFEQWDSELWWSRIFREIRAAKKSGMMSYC